MMRDRAGDAGTLHHRLADAAEAEHEHGRAGLDLRGVEHRAHAGLHRAPDDAHDVEGRVVGDLHRAGLGGDHELGEAADAEAAVHDLTAARQPGAAVGERGRRDAAVVHAHAALAAHAAVALPARRDRA